jgi:hypothetical protein
MAFKFGIGDLVTIEGEHKEPCTAVVVARYTFETSSFKSNYYILWAGRPGGGSLHLHDRSEDDLMTYARRLQLSDPCRAIEQLADDWRTNKDELLRMALEQEAEQRSSEMP